MKKTPIKPKTNKSKSKVLDIKTKKPIVTKTITRKKKTTKINKTKNTKTNTKNNIRRDKKNRVLGDGKTKGNAEAKQERMHECWQLRLQGYNYREIANEIGITQSTAFKYCKEVLNEKIENRKHTAEELREQEVQRQEKLLKVCLGGNRMLKEGYILNKIEEKDNDGNILNTTYEKIINPQYVIDPENNTEYLMYTNIDHKLIEKAIKISERIAKLQGLDMPVKQLLGEDKENPLPKTSNTELLTLFQKMVGDTE